MSMYKWFLSEIFSRFPVLRCSFSSSSNTSVCQEIWAWQGEKCIWRGRISQRAKRRDSQTRQGMENKWTWRGEERDEMNLSSLFFCSNLSLGIPVVGVMGVMVKLSHDWMSSWVRRKTCRVRGRKMVFDSRQGQKEEGEKVWVEKWCEKG